MFWVKWMLKKIKIFDIWVLIFLYYIDKELIVVEIVF